MGTSSHLHAGTDAAEVRERIALLESERELAGHNGLISDRAYMADLMADIAAASTAYVAVSVIEIAYKRAELSGPLLG